MSPAQRIDKAQIVSAAFDVLGSEGVDKLTMRHLAARLGVQAATLYYHVDGRGELLRLVSEQVVAEATAGLTDAGDWRTLCVDVVTRLRETLRRHPGAAQVVAVQEVSAEAFEKLVPLVLTSFHAGLNIDDADALYLVQSLYVLVTGLALAEFGDAPSPAPAPRSYYDAWFTLSVETFLDGIQHRYHR
ncbi:TetR/AcrR family transcriptional regulator [Rathayibacter sp. CAU 1779]